MANEGSPAASSLNPAPRGTKALFLLLEEMGYPVRRWFYSSKNLRDRRGVLFLFGPFESPLPVSEARSLVAWVERGNTLVYFSSAGEALPLNLSPQELGVPAGGRGEDALLDAIGLYRVRRTGETATLPSAARGTEAWSRQALPDRETNALFPFTPSRLTGGVRRVASSPRVKVEWMGPAGWLPLLGDLDGGEVWLGARGTGTVVLGFTASPLQNRMLGRLDNLPFALRLVDAFLDSGEEILFDERVHGLWLDETRGATLFNPETLHWLGLQIALVGTAYLFSKGRRFGPVVPLSRPAPRSSVELAESLADLYRQADVKADVWRWEAARFRRLVQRRMGSASAEGARGEEPARAGVLARAGGRRGGDRARVIGQAMRGGVPATLHSRDLVLLDGAIERLLREIEGGTAGGGGKGA